MTDKGERASDDDGDGDGNGDGDDSTGEQAESREFPQLRENRAAPAMTEPSGGSRLWAH